ncbi:winged helix-turn-helix domain-containing protein [Shewanella surugensis]|uniref:Winged helix-turn-helix domain-containing protein n=1 Tax=Shewanella surugensis TaxID=212020 RepID=A0ABT0LIA4_9GAMM|nr:winged helix-turn-helix domain-containing protein [Shewanella surugensis]MCL1127424.1 winged helix-turn-helix domain-containing protein [Shewanella surugensis]
MQLGDYFLDRETMLLHCGDEEKAIEPKVYDVLMYLVENRQRHISITELHENVWKGRFVSDAAVRKIISKLRLLFDDNHNEPKYIKSLSKRGYRLICHVDLNKKAIKSIPPVPDISVNAVNSLVQDPQFVSPSTTFSNYSQAINSQSNQSQKTDDINKIDINDLDSKGHGSIVDGEKIAISSKAVNRSFWQRLTQLQSSVLVCSLLLLVSGLSYLVYFYEINITPDSKTVVENKALYADNDGRDNSTQHIDEQASLVMNETNLLKTLTGDKIGVAVHDDKQLTAFAMKLDEGVGYQIFLKDMASNKVMQLVQNVTFPLSLTFNKTGDKFYYIDHVEGSSSLIEFDLASNEYARRTLITDYFGLYDLSFSPTIDNKIYFTGELNKDDGISGYSYNFSSKEIVPVTDKVSANFMDFRMRFSNNGQQLAVLRLDSENNQSELRIIDLPLNKVVYRRWFEQRVYYLEWLNEHMLAVLSNRGLYRLDISTDMVKVFNGDYNFRGLELAKSNENLYLLRRQSSDNRFVSKTLPFSEFVTDNIIEDDLDLTLMGGQNNNDKAFFTGITATHYVLSQFDYQTNEHTELVKVKDKLRFLYSSRDGNKILYKEDKRLVFLTLSTGDKQFLSNKQQRISYARFSKDEAAIIYGVKQYDIWVVNRFDIATGETTELFKGYQDAIEYREGYVLVNDDFELILYQNSQQQALGYKLNSELYNLVFIMNDYLYWQDTDYIKVIFNELNLTTFKHEQKEFDFLPITFNMAINQEAGRLWYNSRKRKSELYHFNINRFLL